MDKILTVQNIIIYFVIINLLGFLSMWIDKRKAQKGKWRTQEKTLFLIALFGGAIGSIAGMYKFRHKTKKMYFVIGMPMILIMHILIAVLILI